jgi:hypothetical protein
MRLRSLIHDGREAKRGTGGPAAALALGLGLALAGCSAGYVENNTASVNLLITSINDGAQLDSDVRNGVNSTFVCENEVPVAVTARNKNPNGPTAASSDIQLDSYEVRYTRTDGRGVEGVDVPYRVTGTLSATVAIDGTVSVPIEVVRRQAKLDPPLNNINQTTVLTVNAQVTLYGKTVSGQRVTATGFLQIDFADFGDTATSCPTN